MHECWCHVLDLQYYFGEGDIGKARDACSVPQLAELNTYVQVTTLPEATLSEGVLDRFHVVLFTNTAAADLAKYNAYCRSKSPAIGFIAADVRGVAGRAFVDFGPEHMVLDADGEPVRSAIVANIMRSDGKVIVDTHDAKRHGLSDGDSVIFRELDGAVELNDGVPRTVSNCRAYNFELNDAPASFGAYSGNGIVEQVKVPKPTAFKSWEERVASPDGDGAELFDADLGKWGRARALHAAFAGLDAFAAQNGNQMPAAHDEAAAAAVATAAEKWAADAKFEAENIADVAQQLARYSAVELPALCAFYGGVLAQEVVKFTGKYSPLNQFLYLDVFDIVPKVEDAADFVGTGDRYHFSNVIFGQKLTQHIREQNVFVVGAGALGCEFLKNFAQAGLCTAGKGKLYVTDMDNIEVSNLNRQFLFRPKDVGAPKSVTAGTAVAAMNPDLAGRITAMEDPVGGDTEHIFNDEFWGSLHFVTNALDNVKARSYVDNRCVWFNLPLLESGTLGCKANTQVIYPSLTESYTDSQDPPEESIPMCTLKNFPNQIEHCIEWSRDNFQGYFAGTIQEAKAFASNPDKWITDTAAEPNPYSRRQKLQGVVDTLAEAKDATWEACVHRARLAFNTDYTASIKQLLHNFPADHVNKEGTKFWSGPKRCPQVPSFDVADPLHKSYIAHAAALFAYAWGVDVPADFDDIGALSQLLASAEVPQWAPKHVRIQAGDDDDTKEGGDDDDVVAEQLVQQLKQFAATEPVSKVAAALQPADFEKDDDSNHHIDFIAASANLRAWNYRIAEASQHKVKMIAGKIIPAIATTTCAVTGLVMVELYKIIQLSQQAAADRKIDSLRNTFVNLAINSYYAAEPGEPKKRRSVEMDPVAAGPIRAVPEAHTKWERIILKVDAATTTVEDIIKQVQQWVQAATEEDVKAERCQEGQGVITADNVEVTLLAVGTTMMYSDFFPAHASRLTKNFRGVYVDAVLKGEQPHENYVVVGVGCEADGMELAIPECQVIFQ